MKPAAFDYVAPRSVDEAVALLARHGEDAKVLAGGQSLVPMMNFRLVRPRCLVDLNRIGALSYVRESDGVLRIGAMTRQRLVERSPAVHRNNRLLLEGVRLIGHTGIRNRGTIGGSIIHADPTAELPTVLAALDGGVRVAGPAGGRTIGWRDLFVTYFTTTLEPVEICEEVVVPALPPNAGWAFEEFTHRHGDFALVGVAAVVEADARGRCAGGRLAVAGCGPTPVRAGRAEAFLKGQPLETGVLVEAGRLVGEEVEPESDLHASEAYRRHLAATMAIRALRRAAERTQSVAS